MRIRLLIAASAIPLLLAPPARIVIDGDFSDWQRITPALVDPTDAPGSNVDFGEVRIFADARFLNLMADFRRPVSVHNLGGTASLLLDVDGHATTGRSIQAQAGVDLVIEMSPPARTPGMVDTGIAVRTTPSAPAESTVSTAYEVGFVTEGAGVARISGSDRRLHSRFADNHPCD